MGDQEKENLTPESEGESTPAGQPEEQAAAPEETQEPAPVAEEAPAPVTEEAPAPVTEEAPAPGADAPATPPEPKAALVSFDPQGAGPFYGTGRRKTSVARVYLKPGSGQLTVNGRALEEFFNSHIWRNQAVEPLTRFGVAGKFDAAIQVQGGGSNGQADAVRLGIARALAAMNPEGKKALREAGFLTRDARRRERKKYGQKGARRRFQWTKR